MVGCAPAHHNPPSICRSVKCSSSARRCFSPARFAASPSTGPDADEPISVVGAAGQIDDGDRAARRAPSGNGAPFPLFATGRSRSKLRRRFGSQGIHARSAAGTPLGQTAPVRLVAALEAFAANRDARASLRLLPARKCATPRQLLRAYLDEPRGAAERAAPERAAAGRTPAVARGLLGQHPKTVAEKATGTAEAEEKLRKVPTPDAPRR